MRTKINWCLSKKWGKKWSTQSVNTCDTLSIQFHYNFKLVDAIYQIYRNNLNDKNEMALYNINYELLFEWNRQLINVIIVKLNSNQLQNSTEIEDSRRVNMKMNEGRKIKNVK